MYKLIFCIQFGRDSTFKVLPYIFALYLACAVTNHLLIPSSCDIYSKLLALFCTNCAVFRNVTPCSPVNTYWLLDGTCFLCLLPWRWGHFIRNVGINMLHCMLSRSMRLYWWYSVCSTNSIMMLLCASVWSILSSDSAGSHNRPTENCNVIPKDIIILGNNYSKLLCCAEQCNCEVQQFTFLSGKEQGYSTDTSHHFTTLP